MSPSEWSARGDSNPDLHGLSVPRLPIAPRAETICGANDGIRTRTSRLGRPAGAVTPHSLGHFSFQGPHSSRVMRAPCPTGDSARTRTRTHELWRLGCFGYTTLPMSAHVSIDSKTQPPCGPSFLRAGGQKQKRPSRGSPQKASNSMSAETSRVRCPPGCYRACRYGDGSRAVSWTHARPLAAQRRQTIAALSASTPN